MQRDPSLVLVTPVPTDAGAPSRPPAAHVPSEQLWREAIRATRQAATAAAELRQALEATRGSGPPAP